MPVTRAGPVTDDVRPDPADRPFGRTVLREQVKDILLQRIVSGESPFGSRLVETRIAHELGISQAPVREALRDLEQLGLVVHEPFRGCSVRRFSVPDLLEAFPVRSALEELAARRAAELIIDEELARLADCVERMRAAAEEGDPHGESVADVDFHATIVGAARNRTLERQWRLLQPFPRTFLSVTRPNYDLAALSERHVPILRALEARDGEAAADELRRHLMDVVAELERLESADTGKEAP